MINKLVASAALLASATLVDALGQAVVVNQCSYDVTLTNVPASGGGASQIGPQQLSTGGTYSQTWTSLTNGQGWSMKLSVGSDMTDIVQYEYTYLNDGVIWYDLSAVNGDPFNGDWSIAASGSCAPHQNAYRYPTDDEHGMQSSCPADSTITVTLCSSGGGAPAPAPSAPAPTYAPAPEPAPAPPASGRPGRPDGRPDGRPSPPEAAPQPDTPYTGPPSEKLQEDNAFGEFEGGTPAIATVTNVKTEVVTQYVTVSPSPIAKRSEHLHRHAHRHNQF